MKKIVFFGSTPEIADSAKRFANEDGRDDIDVLEVATEDCVQTALKVFREGAQVIIARGTQAAAIKHNTDIPVVEVVLTAQEMALVITQIKRDLKKPVPVIAVVGYRNMFCDMRHFGELFGIALREIYVKGTDELPEGVNQAFQDKVDIVIGGEIVCRCAQALGLPSRMQPSGEDSIRQAFRNASSVAFAAEQEKKTVSELNTLLDFSFNALLKIDDKGIIQALNRQIEELFGASSAKLVGSHIDALIPSLYTEHLYQEVIRNGRDIFTVLRLKELVLAVSAAPITVEEQVAGAIVSCHEVRRLTEMQAETRKEMENGASPHHFEQFFTDNLAFIRTVRHYAQFETGILIVSDPGFTRETPAHLIHQESARNASPFYSYPCGAWPKEQQLSRLFGDHPNTLEKGLAMRAHTGILFIDDVELLGEQAQYRLYKLITEGQVYCDGAPPTPVNLRIITGTQVNLWKLVQEGGFRQDLYFLLSTLVLHLPTMEAEHWANLFIQQYCARHYRYLNLTKGARLAIAQYKWDGGLVELNSFCERLVITAPQRTVDEALVNRLLRQNLQIREHPERFVRDPEANRLAKLLEEFGGNRTKVAEVLGISKTTLWRRMKNLGLYDTDQSKE